MKLSIVATSRNDNHGGDMRERMQLFIDGLFYQCNKFNFETELILVEWNPPADRPRLIDALAWNNINKYCQVRIIEVPDYIHNRHKYSSGLPLFQMIAKNVGIVRARAEYILSTNVDIIFSDEAFEFFNSDKLEKGVFYRADRHDISREIYNYETINEVLDACKELTIRINMKDGIYDCITDSKQTFKEVFPKIPFMGKRRKYIPGIKQLEKYGESSLVLNCYRLLGKYRSWLQLHTNACGDFTLMSMEDWMKIKGAPEFELFSLHIDTLVCYSAHFAGIRQVLLDCPIYHIEHDGGWTPEKEKVRSLYKHYEKVEVPIMSIREIDNFIGKMYKAKGDFTYNSNDWGLVNEDLKESVLS